MIISIIVDIYGVAEELYEIKFTIQLIKAIVWLRLHTYELVLHRKPCICDNF